MDSVTGKGSAFSSFNALNNDPDSAECAELMRNMAKLFRHVVDRCDDEQIAKYDEVLCQLAELVEAEARADVAELLAPLSRAPGHVVIKLANDEIEVAAPLLEFSSVLSDDDLIEIVQEQSNDHRFAIAGRSPVTDRVGSELVKRADSRTVLRLVSNKDAVIGQNTGTGLLARAAGDKNIAASLGNRKDVDWQQIHARLSEAGKRALKSLAAANVPVDEEKLADAKAVVLNRAKNEAGFSATEWKVAWGQVKALADRRQFNLSSIERFCRFGYGHHVASSLAILLRIKPEVLVKWLATQDTGAMIVAIRAMNFKPELFQRVFSSLPWRDKVDAEEAGVAVKKYDSLSQKDAHDIFELWRSHSFAKKGNPERQQTVNVA
ncbi:DUF2336 domain-containing protein [Maritalea porphyrae]|uniref:DUF2336 domain-containing protein n=1 Tax=Maritalea porphyrae TaxID=880732 RepID=A0ABQ5UVS8_9HYPH|nr:DUF2336 domain-containing protein [Maritalea porphyrae]GLQ18984.1 hypothetical protein GCM10007879_32330 [Maritalea porphyrae]